MKRKKNSNNVRNINTQNHLLSLNNIETREMEENKALDISLIRAREGRRIRRTNIDWFSL